MSRSKAGNKKTEQQRGEQPWNVPVAVADIPETGRRVELSPDAAIRAAVAKTADVVAVPRLEATFDLARHGHDGMRVTGRLSATVEQNCVVTLEPMQSEIEEAIDLVFAPPRPPSEGDKAEDAGEGHADIDGPEALHDGVLDLGALATEFLILGIDPYPRKPGAVFDAPPAGDPAAHPFAALAALKKDG